MNVERMDSIDPLSEEEMELEIHMICVEKCRLSYFSIHKFCIITVLSFCSGE